MVYFLIVSPCLSAIFAGHLRLLKVQGSDWCQSALDREFLAETCKTTKIDIVEARENYVGNLEI